MERLLTTLSLLITFFSINFDAKAAIITAITNNGAWSTGGTWNRGSVPECGDTIEIPAGLSVNITNNVNLNDASNPLCGKNQLNVAGILRFNNGKKIRLGVGSCINVLLGGIINPSKTGSGNSEAIEIGGVEFWIADDGQINGVAQVGCAVILPNTLVNFDVKANENVINFSWNISEENNIYSYIIEKSNDGLIWENINQTFAKNEEDIDVTYNVEERIEMIETLCYYKLFAINLNGQKNQIGFTSISNLDDLKTEELLIAPNPATSNSIINILSFEKLNKKVSISVLNQLGQTIKTLEIESEFNEKLFLLENLNLNSGTYTLFLNDGDKVLKSKFIIL